ncbi:hypothetical protein KCV07_g345, partial [Aureobasidium melanogenum]
MALQWDHMLPAFHSCILTGDPLRIKHTQLIIQFCALSYSSCRYSNSTASLSSIGRNGSGSSTDFGEGSCHWYSPLPSSPFVNPKRSSSKSQSVPKASMNLLFLAGKLRLAFPSTKESETYLFNLKKTSPGVACRTPSRSG